MFVKIHYRETVKVASCSYSELIKFCIYFSKQRFYVCQSSPIFDSLFRNLYTGQPFTCVCTDVHTITVITLKHNTHIIQNLLIRINFVLLSLLPCAILRIPNDLFCDTFLSLLLISLLSAT